MIQESPPITRLPAWPRPSDSGPVQFGRGWPGTYLCGQDACISAFLLADLAAKAAAASSDPAVLALALVAANVSTRLSVCDQEGSAKASANAALAVVQRVCSGFPQLEQILLSEA